jgi:hypothetical protein
MTSLLRGILSILRLIASSPERDRSQDPHVAFIRADMAQNLKGGISRTSTAFDRGDARVTVPVVTRVEHRGYFGVRSCAREMACQPRGSARAGEAITYARDDVSRERWWTWTAGPLIRHIGST